MDESQIKKKHERVEKFIDFVDPNSVFVEIGAERGEGSTLFLADLAEQHGVKLLTVDLRPKTTICFPEKPVWEKFYSNVRAKSWPEKVGSIDELLPYMKDECIHLHKWEELKNSIPPQEIETANKLFHHSNIEWHVAKGSEWCNSYKDKINKPISFLYLDNFDYIWNIENVNDFNEHITYYDHNWNIAMNNQNCQLEHLLQLMFIVPHLTDSCVVALDDTYLYNDCWIGKSGPGVVYLKALGFEIIEYASESFVILQKPKN